jgi:HAD superfamily hydrolase (TIGR01509 family)
LRTTNVHRKAGQTVREQLTPGIIFDLDGVLFDSHPVHKRAWRSLLQSLGRSVSDEELDFILDGAKREEILLHFLGPLSGAQASAFSAWKDSMVLTEENNIHPMKGLEAFLDLLGEAAILKAVATSASKARAQRMLERCNLAYRFAAVFTGDDVSSGKSSPEIFLRSAEALKSAPHKTLVFEDAIPAIRTAKRIGMKCIGLAAGRRKSCLLEAGADFVVSDFTDLSVSDILGLFE